MKWKFFDTAIDDIDERLFADYFKEFKVSYQEKGLTYEEALRANVSLEMIKFLLPVCCALGKNLKA